MNGSAALDQYPTLVDLAASGVRGTVDCASAHLVGVDRATVHRIVDAVGDAPWRRGRRGQPGTGPPISTDDLRAALAEHHRFDLLYFET